MKEMILNRAGENAAAFGTVTGGSWLTYEAMTQGMNLIAAFLGIVSACLAIWWWSIKIRKEVHGQEAGDD